MGQHQHLTYRAITMVRGQLISLLYDKATEISITTADPTAVLTLMSATLKELTWDGGPDMRSGPICWKFPSPSGF